jgi:hypothetical protein
MLDMEIIYFQLACFGVQNKPWEKRGKPAIPSGKARLAGTGACRQGRKGSRTGFPM